MFQIRAFNGTDNALTKRHVQLNNKVIGAYSALIIIALEIDTVKGHVELQSQRCKFLSSCVCWTAVLAHAIFKNVRLVQVVLDP